MLPNKFLLTLIAIALIGIVFMLFSDRSFLLNPAPDTSTPAEAGGVPVETRSMIPSESNSAPDESVETQAASQLDGSILLENYCAKCHVTKGLELYKKSRSEWQSTLDKMENFGVRPSEAESIILIDFLAGE